MVDMKQETVQANLLPQFYGYEEAKQSQHFFDVLQEYISAPPPLVSTSFKIRIYMFMINIG